MSWGSCRGKGSEKIRWLKFWPHNTDESQPQGNEEDQEGKRETTQEMMGVEIVGQEVEKKGTGEKDISK